MLIARREAEMCLACKPKVEPQEVRPLGSLIAEENGSHPLELSGSTTRSQYLSHWYPMSFAEEEGFETYSFSTGYHDLSPSIPEIVGNLFKSVRRVVTQHCTSSPQYSLRSSAEEEGFEPSKGFPPCRFSKPVPSTTQPLLR